MKWLRPSGTTIETNDSAVTIKKCESMGWTPVRKESAAPPPPEDAPKKKSTIRKSTKKRK